MKPSQIRALGLGLLSAALAVGSLAFDLHDQNAAQRVALAQTQRQTERLQLAARPEAVVVRERERANEVRRDELQHWRLLAAGYGSEALNVAAALRRTKAWCVQSGLLECAVRKSGTAAARVQGDGAGASLASVAALAASTPAAEPALDSYAVTLSAAFAADATRRLLARADACDCIQRIDRMAVQQSRLEMDVVFFHSLDVRRPGDVAAEVAATRVPAASGPAR